MSTVAYLLTLVLTLFTFNFPYFLMIAVKQTKCAYWCKASIKTKQPFVVYVAVCQIWHKVQVKLC